MIGYVTLGTNNKKKSEISFLVVENTKHQLR